MVCDSRTCGLLLTARPEAYDLIMCEYFCVGFIDFMLKGKTLMTKTFMTNV